MPISRVLVAGLDCLTPRFAFERYLGLMPNLHRLMEGGVWGPMTSSDPPITVPAWMAMACSRDPGSLGVYGFRHRRGTAYNQVWTAGAATFDLPAVWDHLGSSGGSTGLVGFPPSYPPRPIPGWRVGCFLTPDANRPFTHPAGLGPALLEKVPDYRFDVVFRTGNRDDLRREIWAMTEAHFDAVEFLASTQPWQLLWFVEIGLDRVHHAFWKFADPEHPLYEPGNPYEEVIADYYALLDRRLGRLLDRLPPDTAVIVVSDHGAMAMKGAFALNQWLVESGYLALSASPAPGTSIEKCSVDWGRTKAWAWGGYYARVFMNVKGREPEGIIDPDDYEVELTGLTDALLSIHDHQGRVMDTRVYRPKDLYRECRGDAPDLMVYLDNLSWRAAGTLGWDSRYLFENDTGPDDAVHSPEGCFVLWPRTPAGRREGLSLYDVAPTILNLFGLTTPPEMIGRPIEGAKPAGEGS